MLKRSLVTTFGLLRLNKVMSVGLDGLAWVLIHFTRCGAWLYRRLWPLLGVGYYDQRFRWAHGPDGWRYAERGFVAYQAGVAGSRILDLACGDGFYPGVFLSALNGEIDAIDLDPRVIRRARSRYGSDRIKFHVGNVLVDPFPRSEYDMVTCFATLQYFSIQESMTLLRKINAVIASRNGAFVGSIVIYTPPCQLEAGAAHNFRTIEEAMELLEIWFDEVNPWRSVWQPGLTHCYFVCRRPRAIDEPGITEAVSRYASRYG